MLFFCAHDRSPFQNDDVPATQTHSASLYRDVGIVCSILGVSVLIAVVVRVCRARESERNKRGRYMQLSESAFEMGDLDI